MHTPHPRLVVILASAAFAACATSTSTVEQDVDAQPPDADASLDAADAGEPDVGDGALDALADTREDAPDADALDVSDADTGDGSGDRPGCTTDDQCPLPEVCVDIVPGALEGLCASPCADATDCDDGFDCVLIGQDVDQQRVCIDLDLCVDADLDGYGVGPGCAGPDCDDAVALVSPAATEICNAVDDDCDGLVDDTVALEGTDCTTPFPGACADGRWACVAGGLDCVARAVPLPELCDGVDNDCDGAIDLGATDARAWYADVDGDRFGDPGTAVVACDAPDDTVDVGGDCDDTTTLVSPVATELCDTVDNNCNGLIDEAFTGALGTWYPDSDGDGYGDPGLALEACGAPDGTIARGGDCNDAAPDVNPAAPEVCDLVDNDCDGLNDEAGALGEQSWFADADGDGLGDDTVVVAACAQPDNTASVGGDCDDSDADVTDVIALRVTNPADLSVPPAGLDEGTTHVDLEVADAGAVRSVRVEVFVNHTDTGDLTLTLVSPSGTRVVLARRRGFDDDFWGTIFDDAAATPISAGSSPFTGVYRPESALGAFGGQAALGTWTLEVTDDFTLEAGAVREVRLDLTLDCAAVP